MTLQDSFVLAWRTVKGNKLRTSITVAIIAFGIMALIGIITAISAMNQSLKENFSFMGANAFTIRYKEMNARMMGGGFGGCVIALVQTTKVEEVFNRINNEYQNKFGRSMGKYLMQIGDGTRLLD